MNYLWAFMILSGVIFSAFHGTIPAVTGAVLDSAKEAVTQVSYTHLRAHET